MLFESFQKRRTETPDAPAFLIASGDRSIPISWRQFTNDIDMVVRLVRTHAPGAKIGLLGENSYEWIVAHAAILFAEATVVPLDTNLSAPEIAARLKFVGASVLVYSALYVEKAHAARELVPGLMTGGFGSIKTERFLDRVRGFLGTQKSVWDQPSVDTSHTSMIVFTSGTTSEPRGAELTLAGLEAHAASWSAALPMAAGQRSLMLLPLHHIFGLAATYQMLFNGVALGVCPDFRRIFDAVARFRANFLFLVPALAEILAKKIDLHGQTAEMSFGAPLDWIVVGGAPMSQRVFEHLSGQGVRVLTAYGLTETTALYSVMPVDAYGVIGSAGRVARFPGVEACVSAEGELLLRGPSVMKGYYRQPAQTAEVIDAEGWFHTGDIGRIDEAGFVWVTGRASRTIILSSGKKVAPEELEERLLAIPGVLEAVVRGEGETREITAEIYGRISEEALQRAVGALNISQPVYKRIKKTVMRQEPFPRTSSGKIRL